MAFQNGSVQNILGSLYASADGGLYLNGVPGDIIGIGDLYIIPAASVEPIVGELLADAFAGQTLNSSVDPVIGTLDGSAYGESLDPMYVELWGRLSAEANAVLDYNIDALLIGHGDIGEIGYVVETSVFVSMYGFLYCDIDLKNIGSFCPDLKINFETLVLESAACGMKGESMDIIRYRGDTYPIVATLGRNGNFDVTGITFTMSVKIGDGQTYSVSGVVANAAAGLVEFYLPEEAVAIPGEGVYDIQGYDAYIYTYDKGKFILLDDVTK